MFDQEVSDGFRKICQSLKLYRRAELVDEASGDSLIDDLYVDPLRGNKIITTLLEPHTTFLIGRKGTGKSTIFQKMQREILRRGYSTSAYIDIKTIYESSQVDPVVGGRVYATDSGLPKEALEKILLQKAFLESLVNEIRVQLRRRISHASFWSKVKEAFGGGISELDVALEELVQSLNVPTYENAVGILTRATRERREVSADHSIKSSVGLGADGVGLSIEGGATLGNRSVDEFDYSDVLIRTLRMNDFIVKLRELLDRVKVRQLYILIDDFSELPQDGMRFVVDGVLAPLNNWSDELVKLKIAAYPGRIYYGQIDKAKVDEVYLDLYKLHAPADVATMEYSAVDFTKRLVGERFSKFLPGRESEVFAVDDEYLWRELFYASLGNPRILGYVLHFASEMASVRGSKINLKIIKDASRKYYEDKIEPYFSLGRFLHDTFAERLSIFSLKELLEEVVRRARELREHNSEVFTRIKGTPPTSHFHVPVAMESVLQTLELNFFVTKYFEMSDRSGKKVSVYSLNYGLCERYSIRFGRPSGEREFRLYFVERVFDYSGIVLSFLNKNQDISCDTCSAKFSFDQLSAIRMYGMICPQCRSGTVVVANLSQKYADQVRQVSENLLLEQVDLNILAALDAEGSPMKPKDVAEELDCSHQLVGRRAKHLEERELLRRDKDGYQRLYRITPTAQSAYFSNDDGGLDIQSSGVG